jgi:hypothetical protein
MPPNTAPMIIKAAMGNQWLRGAGCGSILYMTNPPMTFTIDDKTTICLAPMINDNIDTATVLTSMPAIPFQKKARKATTGSYRISGSNIDVFSWHIEQLAATREIWPILSENVHHKESEDARRKPKKQINSFFVSFVFVMVELRLTKNHVL